MIKRLFVAWFGANILIAGVAALLTGAWYLRWSLLPRMLAELGLIVLPNLIFPVLLLRYAWTEPVDDLCQALGWQWHGWRSILAGLAAFAIYQVGSSQLARILGPGIPYTKPEPSGAVTGVAVFYILPLLLVFVVLTVAGEEMMFRGLIQTQTSRRYGAWVGMALTVVLFGLRHLPADLFYSQIWHASAGNWLARLTDLYLGAILLSLARHFGRSSYASATMHGCIFILNIVSGLFSS